MTSTKDTSRHTKDRLMSIVRREPQTPAWQPEAAWPDDRVERIFRHLMRDVLGTSMLERFGRDGETNLLHLEEFVEDGTLVIRAELPGVDPEKDVELTLRDGVLDLQAHREERSREELPGGYRSEFHYGSFRRSVRLPEGTTEDDIKASYKDGILEVRIPMKGDATPPTPIAIDRG
ncbi:MAG TPA: Hsp20/alpha crystallin family protein [Jatrophihabitans sp.]|jgi:HSP20 family protein|uniref:Hsp20/alpha crystallin family protein n=1 Tax=Jatrophihabitans sp. TaxID=1932789 RepID=UPI002DFAA725|nr:Hsp20/alpha crystallin family protein [Jatrophihabitans sp.]